MSLQPIGRVSVVIIDMRPSGTGAIRPFGMIRTSVAGLWFDGFTLKGLSSLNKVSLLSFI